MMNIKELLASSPSGQLVELKAWVRTFRNNQFIALNDSGEEVFRFNRKNNGNYVLESIRIAIKHNRKYKNNVTKTLNNTRIMLQY